MADALAECKAASQAIVKAIESNEAAQKKYAIDRANYITQLNNYNTTMTAWQTKYDDKKAVLAGERVSGSCSCGWNCGGSSCPAGWEGDGSAKAPNCGKAFGTCGSYSGCAVNCRRSSTQLGADIAAWVRSNPKPTIQPPIAPQVPVPISLGDMICQSCQQSVDLSQTSNTKTGTITQMNNCIASLSKNVDSGSGNGSSSTGGNAPYQSPNKPPQPKSNKTILYVVLFLILLIILGGGIGIAIYAFSESDSNESPVEVDKLNANS